MNKEVKQKLVISGYRSSSCVPVSAREKRGKN